MGALRDCETVARGLLGQPVNSLTTLAFVVGGVVIIRWSSLRWVGVASIATGLGSFLFHGPMPSWGEWAHDTTLAWLLLVVGGVGRRHEQWTRLRGLAALGALFAIVPVSADAVGAALAVVAIVLILSDDRSMSSVGPVTLLAIVATLGRLGSTGGLLCDPGSPWQLHGLWHVGAAAALTWWALARPDRGQVEPWQRTPEV